MVEKTCTCHRWELNGIPCAHACAVIFGNNEEPEDYVHDCYSMRTYLRVYSHVIHPINGHDMWPKASKDYIITPNEAIKRKKGRKQMARKKIVEELEMATAKVRLSRKGMGSSQRPTRVLNNVEDTMADVNVFKSLQTSSSQQTTIDATENGPIKGNSKK
ncbi:hypothetical protein GH714_042392 [Hevea brasiliensis]|uniref:SWIM-type domain-containing protein n=1 Tax=Hevea brasiliensis TaxID=3981 RepID=A0A6A6LR78_HEVBR|nr:hypothetical protein GH714_042392 [Hevea brasiliensis]